MMPDPARSREPEAADEMNGPLQAPVSWEMLRSSQGGRSATGSTPGHPLRIRPLSEVRRSGVEPDHRGGVMPIKRSLVVLALLCLGVSACDDKQAQNNAPTKADSTKMEPQTDQSAPSPQKR
jgi:hypothetical protein